MSISRYQRGSPPPLAKLVGELRGAYSRRVSIQHRVVYKVPPEEGVVKVLRLGALQVS
jgi:Txe/YoeB family toxin of Txe-Axe toxin-antitoxin module